MYVYLNEINIAFNAESTKEEKKFSKAGDVSLIKVY